MTHRGYWKTQARCSNALFSTLYFQYGVVLDAGSSHTGLFVYRWPGPKLNGTGVVRQMGSCNSIGILVSYLDCGSRLIAYFTDRRHIDFLQQRERH